MFRFFLLVGFRSCDRHGAIDDLNLDVFLVEPGSSAVISNAFSFSAISTAGVASRKPRSKSSNRPSISRPKLRDGCHVRGSAFFLTRQGLNFREPSRREFTGDGHDASTESVVDPSTHFASYAECSLRYRRPLPAPEMKHRTAIRTRDRLRHFRAGAIRVLSIVELSPPPTTSPAPNPCLRRRLAILDLQSAFEVRCWRWHHP